MYFKGLMGQGSVFQGGTMWLRGTGGREKGGGERERVCTCETEAQLPQLTQTTPVFENSFLLVPLHRAIVLIIGS